MKGEKWLSALSGTALAFCAAFGGCGCLISAFGMEVSMTTVALWCGLYAVVLPVCFSFRRWVAALGAFALAGGYLWQSRKAVRGAEALLSCLSKIYDSGYGWGVIRWSESSLTTADLTAGVCMVGAVVALAVSFVVCRRRRAYLGLLAALLPLGACMVVTDTVPETRFLFLLLLSIVLLLLTQTTRRASAAQGSRLLGLLALPVGLALALLFLAVPQEGYVAKSDGEAAIISLQSIAEGLTEVPRQLGDGLAALYSGGAVDQIALDQVGPQRQAASRVMEVTAAQNGPLYLRGQAYDTYDGKSWIVSQQDWGGDGQENWSAGRRTIGEVTITTRSVHDVIYLPYNPGDLAQYGGMQRGRVENKDRVKSYTVPQVGTISYGIDVDAARLEQADLARYLALPESTQQWAEEYLAQNQGTLPDPDVFTAFSAIDLLTRSSGALPDSSGSYEELTQAQEIVSLVKHSARYDLNTQRMDQSAEDFAQWFLEDSETGYCVHFATAATVLLRAAGIPARYVTGYLLQGEAGQPVTVRGENAHAWVEIFLYGIGWVQLEPTPAEETESQSTPESPAIQPTSAQATNHETPTQATDAPAVLGNAGDSAGAWKRQMDFNWLWKALQALAWAAGLTAAVIGQWRLRLYLRRRGQYQGVPNAQALARWQEAVYLTRRLNEKPDKALFDLAQKAKYSQYTLTPEELSRFDEFLNGTRNRLRRKPLPMRLIDRLIFAAY